MSATTARFTKKHYEFLAESIRNLVAITDADREKVARQLAERFAATQPSFNRARFITACRGILITPNPYDLAIQTQMLTCRSLQAAHEQSGGYDSYQEWQNAEARLDAMMNGRHATKEEAERLDREDPFQRKVVKTLRERTCFTCGVIESEHDDAASGHRFSTERVRS